MSQETPGAGPAKVPVQCGDCKNFIKSFPWAPGAVCPKCKSKKLAPVTLICGAVDYSIADRSKGYAIEDIRFAKMALWSGLITATQYNDALSRQKAMADRGEPVPHVGRILVDMKVLKESDMEAILEVRCKARPTTDDVDFIKLALGNKYCTEAQVKECEAIMAEYKRAGRDTPPVVFLLLEKRYIKENQAVAIIRAQQKRRLGIIADIHHAIEERRPLTTLEKYVGVKGDPKRKYRIAALVGGGGLLLFIWLTYYIFPYIKPYIPFAGAKIGYFCEGCGAAFIAREADVVPTNCYSCGKRTAIYGYHCRKCGAIFGVQNRAVETVKCPRCKSDKFEDLTPAIIAETEAAKAKKLEKKRLGE